MKYDRGTGDLQLEDIDLKRLIARKDIEESVNQLKGLTGSWNKQTIPARMPIRGRVVAMPVGLADVKFKPMLVWLREVSAEGRKVMVTEEMMNHSLLLLGTRMTLPSGLFWELTQVRNKTEEGKGHILHGVKVIRIVTGEEVSRLLGGDMETLLAVCTLPEEAPEPVAAKAN